jgi:hypothetical protein
VRDNVGVKRSRCSLIVNLAGSLHDSFFMEYTLGKITDDKRKATNTKRAPQVEEEFVAELQQLFLKHDATMEINDLDNGAGPYISIRIPWKYRPDLTPESEGVRINIGRKF